MSSADAWRDAASCAGLDGRNGDDFLDRSLFDQRWLCKRCPVREACLSDALRVDRELGRVAQASGVIRGGLTALERLPLLSVRRCAA